MNVKLPLCSRVERMLQWELKLPSRLEGSLEL